LSFISARLSAERALFSAVAAVMKSFCGPQPEKKHDQNTAMPEWRE
jgi:hypothetical protein